ncbi:uncharacterized protein LOC116213131 [Punica granatum]|uniref:Uncharacterized protein n=2 Tax=Punica granatum TaxID=22663 RepID=A0A218WDP0_PUNGR|nr:uncharacterized protein LOC116213131 [Punica granatum]OWM70599.1 hypothetical protein CDL15_Pgr014272 [Punica granatum]PKI55138.1 hypothetical protein CRG98_024429 [Punica granatum]
MVGVFGHSLSFPNKTPNRPPKPPMFSHHTRSVSLPCRSHPLVSQLKDSISELDKWSSSSSDNSSSSESTSPRTSAWLCAGLAQLRDVHDSLDDILQLPQTLETLSRHRQLVEKLLEDLLRFVDAYGIFWTSILALKEEQAAAQVAIRKKDEPRIGSYLQALRKISREMHGLVSAIRSTGKSGMNIPIPTVGPDAELVTVILSGVDVTVKVSIALFDGISASFMLRKSSPWAGFSVSRKSEKTEKKAIDESIVELWEANVERLLRGRLTKMKGEEVKMALKRMQEMESCIGVIEGGSERVFRSLISTRVSLLNSLTQR